jgi:hypothetical protein
MACVSLSITPVQAVRDSLSEPARSTRCSLLVITFFSVVVVAPVVLVGVKMQ